MLIQVTEKGGREFLLNTLEVAMMDDLIDSENHKVIGTTVTFKGIDEYIEIEETIPELSKAVGAKIVRSGASVK